MDRVLPKPLASPRHGPAARAHPLRRDRRGARRAGAGAGRGNRRGRARDRGRRPRWARGDGLAGERGDENGSSFHSPLGLVLSDFQHWLGLRWRPTSVLASWLLAVLGGRRLRRLIAAEHPAVIVSTYPGVTEVLGRLRSLRRLPIPVVAAVTDLAALRFWVHPSADLHLVIHPESAAEGAVDRGGGRGGGGGHGVLLAGAPLTSLPRGGAGGAGSGYGGTSGGRVGGRVDGR